MPDFVRIEHFSLDAYNRKAIPTGKLWLAVGHVAWIEEVNEAFGGRIFSEIGLTSRGVITVEGTPTEPIMKFSQSA